MEISKDAARLTFWDWVSDAFERRKAMNSLAAADYLVSLLERFLRQDGVAAILSEPLLVELQKSLRKEDAVRFARIRQIGDASLFTAGVLGPHLTRSLVCIRHYVNVGESAYRSLFMSLDRGDSISAPHHELTAVYSQFSRDLMPFVKVLNEVSVEHIFPADLGDLLTVYRRYLKTKTDADRLWLLEHGVVLLDGPDPNKLILQ